MSFEKLTQQLKIDSKEFHFQFQSHPNYPTALAFSNTLNFLGIINEAYELEKDYWEELPKEFVTIYENNFTLVQRKGTQAKIFTDEEKQISFDELKKNSKDFILLLEKNTEEKVSKKDTIFPKIIIAVVFGLLLSVSFLNWNLWSFLFQLLSFAGLYMFSEIFKEKFGKGSPLLQNFCGVDIKQSTYRDACKTIIQSEDFKIYNLKFSDFGFIYFIGLSILPLLVVNMSILFCGISGLALCSIIYSVYYQISRKSFCKICGVVIGILISQFAIAYLFFGLPFQTSEIIIAIFTFLVVFLGVYQFSVTIEEKEKHRKANIKNLRFKRNYEIFKDQLLKRDNKVDFKVNTGGFILGNPNAEFKISIVSNPFCGYCKGAHLLLEKLILQYPNNLQAQIRFNYGGKNDTELTYLLSVFKNLYINQGEKKFSKALNFWYETRDLDVFKEKYPLQNEIDLSDIIELSKDNAINHLNFTPLLIINNYQFPKNYDREDISFFIDELLEDEEILNEKEVSFL
ncbi:ABC transporter permease [Weeksellaceae bacterium A-14]